MVVISVYITFIRNNNTNNFYYKYYQLLDVMFYSKQLQENFFTVTVTLYNIV